MADSVVTVDQVKPQLKLEADDHEQDAHVQRLIDTAQAAIENYIGRGIVATWPNTDDPKRIIAGQAIGLLVEEWFVRGVESTMQQGILWLLRPLKRYTL